MVFDGHSIVVDPTGKVVIRGRDFAGDLLVYDIDLDASSGRPGELRQVAESTEEEAVRALELGLRDYARKTGFETVLLGLSGGIDSALVAYLAADAIEAAVDKVIAAHPDKFEEYRQGRTGLAGFFVGQVMRETRGAANPELVNELVKARLDD